MKYLFLSAHTDDHELSCGGTIQKIKEQGHDVYCQALSWCNNDPLRHEFCEAHDILGIAHDRRRINAVRVREFYSQNLGNFFYSIKDSYDYVFTHSLTDRHDDHRVVAEQARRVLNCNLLNYMCPFNGELSPNYFVEISGVQLEKKIEALACYKSQSHRSYMNPDFIRSQAIYNGIKCGKKYAEAFRIEKMIA